MDVLFIVLAVLGIVLIILPEYLGRAPQGASIRERLGERSEMILGIVGSVGMLIFLIGLIGFLLNRFVPNVDLSQGIQFNSRESLLLWGALQIRYYGIIIVLAMLVAANVAARLAVVDQRNPEHIWGALTWAIIPGIILARLWFVTFPPAVSGLTAGYYYSNFFDLNNGAIAIWSGGLSIFGAVIGGFGGAYIYFVRNGLAVPAWLDIAAVALPLGQAIGRWANYVNQELYGAHTNLPWGIQIDSANRVFPYESTVQWPVSETLFHPLFLYESLWSFVAFIVLLNLFLRNRHKMTPGNLFLIYLLQYSLIRFLLEFLRLEVSELAGLNVSQVVTALVFVVAGVLYVMRRGADVKRKNLKDRPLPSEATA
jgi:phosphatidylglycerol---prolipoprotein diacylglyceryl transferase